MKSKTFAFIADFFLFPFVYPAGLLLHAVRRYGVGHLPRSRKALHAAGVLPIRDHYYEPLINPKHLTANFDKPRHLPGIDWNTSQQLEFLLRLTQYAGELKPEDIPDNRMFGHGDSEYWYCLVRELKPRRIIEVGSGFSTRIARMAIARNGNQCAHTCIEPYENPWLEETGATIIRKRVEVVDADLFLTLESNDILFIDSSHVIRPEGDVLAEVLHILPVLKSGVIVHFHDIFSPRHYPYSWVVEHMRLWNEQYLLEAFLTHNGQWEILGALSYLYYSHHQELAAICTSLERIGDGPGSLYIRRR